MRRNKYGLPENIEGSNNGNWKGGIHVRGDGYVFVRKGVIKKDAKGAKYVLQHRLVMEQHLKRPLLRSEIVHHKNGDKSDNRVDNLEVMTQAIHAKLHIKQDKKTGRIISDKTSTMNKKPAPQQKANSTKMANPKNAEKPANIKAVFGTPKKK